MNINKRKFIKFTRTTNTNSVSPMTTRKSNYYGRFLPLCTTWLVLCMSSASVPIETRFTPYSYSPGVDIDVGASEFKLQY
jgi:hypothetical protein